MQGCFPPRLAFRLLILCLTAPGCGTSQPPSPDPSPAPLPVVSTHFDPATAGTLRGRVTWQGDLPVVPPFSAHSPPLPIDTPPEARRRDNPNAPRIDTSTRGVGNAVVFLRGVDPEQARPWDLPPVRVEQSDLKFHVLQGAVDGQVGFVRRGDLVEMESKEERFHSLHASGAAYFTLPFPDAGRPSSRRLNEKAMVELTSAAHYYWMRGYLFVDDHPYYTRTDAQGNFELKQVPPGDLEVVCWMPSWLEEHHERDPEMGFISRLVFRQPVERVQRVNLKARETRALEFIFSSKAFAP